MLVHACPGCGALVPYGKPRCDACQRAYDEQREERRRSRERRRRAASDAAKDPKYRAFYRSKEWRTLSAYALARAGFRCEDCGGIACEVHHEPPIQTPTGWGHRLDPDHVHALCTKCHNARHRRFCRDGGHGGGGSKSFGPDE